MGEISMGYYTLVDLAKMLAPGDNDFLKVAETLARKNPIVREAPIIEANQAVINSPELVNSDPYGAGWLFSVSVSSLGALISADEYEDLITE